MSTSLTTALIAAVVSLLTIILRPRFVSRAELWRHQKSRSRELLERYSEPLTRAAFDLQSRLYSILRQDFFGKYRAQPGYAVGSTLWLFGQFLAWMEILRREVQVLDLGSVARTSRLQRYLLDVVAMLSEDSIADPQLAIYRGEQRAIGEIMVVPREVAGQSRTDCMGYAEFHEKLGSRQEFARWFDRLKRDITYLTYPEVRQEPVRAVFIQRALVDLIDFFDSERVRFPDVNERGRIPLPAGAQDPKRTRRPHRIARFRYAPLDPNTILDAWMLKFGLVPIPDAAVHRCVPLGGRSRHTARMLVTKLDSEWLEMYIIPDADRSRLHQLVDEGTKWPSADSMTKAQRRLANNLLCRFDRPALQAVSRRSRLRRRLTTMMDPDR